MLVVLGCNSSSNERATNAGAIVGQLSRGASDIPPPPPSSLGHCIGYYITNWFNRAGSSAYQRQWVRHNKSQQLWTNHTVLHDLAEAIKWFLYLATVTFTYKLKHFPSCNWMEPSRWMLLLLLRLLATRDAQTCAETHSVCAWRAISLSLSNGSVLFGATRGHPVVCCCSTNNNNCDTLNGAFDLRDTFLRSSLSKNLLPTLCVPLSFIHYLTAVCHRAARERTDSVRATNWMSSVLW